MTTKRVTTKDLSEQVNKLTDIVSVLIDLNTNDSATNKQETVVQESTPPSNGVYDKTFVSKFGVQLGRAKNLAKDKNVVAEISAVPRKGDLKCYYYTQGRKMASNAVKLVEVHPNGVIKQLSPLGNLKIA